MKITEVIKEGYSGSYGWKGNYSDSYADLLHEMSIVVSLTADEGGNFDDSIQAAMEDFYDEITNMGLDHLTVETDLTFERAEDFSSELEETDGKKDRFVGNLKDPAAQELSDVATRANKTAGRGWSFNVYHADKQLATIIGRPPGMDTQLAEGNMIEFIKRIVNNTQHWTYKTWKGDVESEFAVYVVRK